MLKYEDPCTHINFCAHTYILTANHLCTMPPYDINSNKCITLSHSHWLFGINSHFMSISRHTHHSYLDIIT